MSRPSINHLHRFSLEPLLGDRAVRTYDSHYPNRKTQICLINTVEMEYDGEPQCTTANASTAGVFAGAEFNNHRSEDGLIFLRVEATMCMIAWLFIFRYFHAEDKDKISQSFFYYADQCKRVSTCGKDIRCRAPYASVSPPVSESVRGVNRQDTRNNHKNARKPQINQLRWTLAVFNPVKVEERTPPPVSAPEPDEVPKTEETYGWKHPAELQYYTPENWWFVSNPSQVKEFFGHVRRSKATSQLHLSHVDMMNMFGDNGLGGVDVAQMFTPEFIRAQ
ncbi:hypothetical protein F5878DRAFT_664129 [Lentinula raphanica]|uniref:Uncharacterized protein n=1 Tax=Lentinula raphanica TaxID=153919 RepID=A0AA38P2M5_9AGAR|nr:hypothetical protein F5878DRAFT_664129 [Lentinula raphanica]